MKNSLIKVLVMGIAVLALSSCTTTGSKSAYTSDNGMAGVTTTAGATTSGVSGDMGFMGTDAANANRLRAPYNQVYHFAFNKDSIESGDVDSINVQANYLVAHPNARVRLDGNTDERGSREYNVALGWRRAKAVASILKQQGVSPKQIVLNSYGEEKPVAFCHNESCYKLNRRVALTYEAK